MIVLQKGEILFRQGETGPLFNLREGLLKVERLKEDGTPTLVNLLVPGEVFPHHSLLSQNQYFGTAVAAARSEVKVIATERWYPELENDPQKLYRLALELQTKLTMMQQRIDQITAVKPIDRFLLLRKWFDTHFSDLVLEEVLTQDEIGQFLGMTRETVNRAVKKLNAEIGQ